MFYFLVLTRLYVQTHIIIVGPFLGPTVYYLCLFLFIRFLVILKKCGTFSSRLVVFLVSRDYIAGEILKCGRDFTSISENSSFLATFKSKVSVFFLQVFLKVNNWSSNLRCFRFFKRFCVLRLMLFINLIAVVFERNCSFRVPYISRNQGQGFAF